MSRVGSLASQDIYDAEEGAFQEGIRATPWFSEFAQAYGGEPNLADPNYDYRKAWAEGARPTTRDPGDGLLHWPSQFKGENHPNRVVGGIDTKTGQPVEYAYSDLGVPIGASQTDNSVTDLGQADLRGFAMGALAQQRNYQPFVGSRTTGTDPWKALDVKEAKRDEPRDPTLLDPATNQFLGSLAVPTEPWEIGLTAALGPAGKAAGAVGKTAMATAGMLGSMVDPAEASIFGKLAKTADPKMFAKAEEMFKAGKSPGLIKYETGLEMGADKLWRGEISDRDAFIKKQGKGLLGDLIEHPELFRAYPDLANIETEIGARSTTPGLRASYSPAEGQWAEQLKTYQENPDTLSSILHELTHATQSREGFARGSNPFVDEVHEVAAAKIKAEKEQAGVIYDQLANARHDWMKEFAEKNGLDLKKGEDYDRVNRTYKAKYPHREVLRDDVFDVWQRPTGPSQREKVNAYQSWAGEVEARNVQKRMDMTDYQLRTHPMSETQQIPYEQQVVRFESDPMTRSPALEPTAQAEVAEPPMGSILSPTAEQIVKYGGEPQGKYGSYLTRFHPQSGELDFVNQSGNTGNAFTTLKGGPHPGKNPEAFKRVIEGEPAPYNYPLIDMAKLQQQNASLVFGPTDRMYAGGNLRQAGDVRFDQPIPQEGGINFPHNTREAEIAGIPADAAPLYSSVTEAAAGNVNQTALDVLEKGRTPYYAPLIMGHGAANSSKQMTGTVLQAVRQAEPSPDAVAKIDEAVKGKLTEKQQAQYPGFGKPEELDQWLDRGLPERTAFTNAMDTKAVKDATGINFAALRYANTDPRLLHTPAGSGGILLGKMRPDVGISQHPLHSNYGQTFFGQRGEIGGMPGNMPFSMLAPDMHRALVPQVGPQNTSFASTPAIQVMRGLAKETPKSQPVTQEMVDNYYEWFRRHPSGWMAAGAAPLGALAATSEREEKL